MLHPKPNRNPAQAVAIWKEGARERADNVFCHGNKKTSEQSGLCSDVSGVDRKDAGAKSCVARVCGLLRLDFPFCNSNPQHLVMTDE